MRRFLRWLLHGSEPLTRLEALRALDQGYRQRFHGVIPRKVQISRLRAVKGQRTV